MSDKKPQWQRVALVRISLLHCPEVVAQLTTEMSLPGPRNVELIHKAGGHYIADYLPADAEKIERWLGETHPDLPLTESL